MPRKGEADGAAARSGANRTARLEIVTNAILPQRTALLLFQLRRGLV